MCITIGEQVNDQQNTEQQYNDQQAARELPDIAQAILGYLVTVRPTRWN